MVIAKLLYGLGTGDKEPPMLEPATGIGQYEFGRMN
jgi:hypothetical protein